MFNRQVLKVLYSIFSVASIWHLADWQWLLLRLVVNIDDQLWASMKLTGSHVKNVQG